MNLGFRKFLRAHDLTTLSTPVTGQATGFESPRNFLKPTILAGLFKLFCRNLSFSTKMFKHYCKEFGFLRKFPPGRVLAAFVDTAPDAWPVTGCRSPRNFLKPELPAGLFKLFCRILNFSTHFIHMQNMSVSIFNGQSVFHVHIMY